MTTRVQGDGVSVNIIKETHSYSHVRVTNCMNPGSRDDSLLDQGLDLDVFLIYRFFTAINKL